MSAKETSAASASASMPAPPAERTCTDTMVVTSADFSSEKYRLLQLNPDLEEAITAGKKIFIVGGPDERAVLCTPDKSFYLKKEDTSNLKLLTTHSDWSGPAKKDTSNPDAKRTITVSGSSNFHYLLEPKTHDTMQLKELLLQAPYESSRRANSQSSVKRAKLHKLFSTSDLVAALQVSENEVMAMLLELHAFEEAGAWRILAPSYQMRVFGDMLDAVVQHDWQALTSPGVSVKQFVAEVDEPMVAVRQCCLLYGAVTEHNGEELCVLDPVKVAMFRAKTLFDEQKAEAQLAALQQHSSVDLADAGWDLDRFLDKWQLRVPESVTVDLDMLRGLVLVKPQQAGKPRRIVYFPEDELPLEPKQRFEKLFEMQEKWTIEQLEPFIKSLVRKGRTQASLLLKHTRTSRQPNSSEKLYSWR